MRTVFYTDESIKEVVKSLFGITLMKKDQTLYEHKIRGGVRVSIKQFEDEEGNHTTTRISVVIRHDSKNTGLYEYYVALVKKVFEDRTLYEQGII